MISALTHQGPACHRLWGGVLAWRRRRAPLMEQVRAVGGSGCHNLQQAGYIRAISPYRAPPRKIYMLSARDHTSGAGLPPPVRGRVGMAPSESTPGGAGTVCGWFCVPRPSASRLDPCSIPVPSTSEKALHDLRSHTSGAGLLPNVRGELAWPLRRAPLVEQERTAGGYGCNDIQQAG